MKKNSIGCGLPTRRMIGCVSFTVGAKFVLAALIPCCLKDWDYYSYARGMDWEMRMVIKGCVLLFKMGDG